MEENIKVEEEKMKEEGGKEESNQIKITTYIDVPDLYSFNQYIISRNKNISSIIFGIVFFVYAIWDICIHKKENLVIDSIAMAFGVGFILYAFVFYKLMMMAKVKKLDLKKLDPIDVIVSDDGILYELSAEKDEKYIPYAWNLVSKVRESENYIYIHLIDKRTILLIRKEDITDSAFILFLKSKLPINKYTTIKCKGKEKY